MHSHIDFGYPWFLSYGHLPVAAFGGVLVLLALARKWSKVWLGLFGLLTLWAVAGFLIMRFGMDINGRATLPTQAFLASGSGKVLDMGAGTGRSTLMVLEARPAATVVALDQFGASYEQHFGTAGGRKSLVEEGTEKLMANLRAAGVDRRATVQPGDMRDMPLDPNSFDAVVNAYAIDHLDRPGIAKALSEASRVLKPGGDFLLILVTKEFWLDVAWGPVVLHTHMHGPRAWEGFVRDAGFQIVEEGTRPGTLYLLARKP
jgi:SAM-dependent methyltransferase